MSAQAKTKDIAFRYNFMRVAHAAFVISAVLWLASMAGLFTKGLNYGVDFKGGIVLEVRLPEVEPIDEIRTKIASLGLESQIQEFGAPDVLLMTLGGHEGHTDPAQVVSAVKSVLPANTEYRRTETIGPKIGADAITGAYMAVIFSLLAISAYIWARFEWDYAIAAMIATMHDVILTFGLFVVMGFEFNLTSLAAILTIAGYSVNDTVVVFDRIRENRKKYRGDTMRQVINRSLNETLSRTLLTGSTNILAVCALLIFGGPVIFTFSLALLFGILVGTFSSIYVASALLLYIQPKNRDR